LAVVSAEDLCQAILTQGNCGRTGHASSTNANVCTLTVDVYEVNTDLLISLTFIPKTLLLTQNPELSGLFMV